MNKKRSFSRIFSGWWIVLTGSFLTFWGHGYHTYGFSALFKPIASELGFSRAVTSIAASIGRLEGGFESPLSGWITDKFGPKWIVLSGVILMSISLMLMYYIDSLWSFYIVWGIMLGTGFNVAVTLPIDTAISNWFVKKRGTVLGIKMIFSGFSGVLVLPLIAWLIDTRDWRFTCVIGGLVMGLVGVPLVLFFLKQYRPEYYGLLPDGAKEDESLEAGGMIERGINYAAEVEETEFTLRQAMKTPTYWLLIVTHSVHGLASSAINIHCVPFLTDIGIDPLRAAGTMAIMIAASIPFRPISGILADRVKTRNLRFLLGAAYLLQGLGITVFLLNQTIAMVYIWFVLYGIGMGAGWTLTSPVRARYFGRKAFGSIGGFSTLFLTPVGVAAPIYLGWVYDTSGNYLTGFALIAGLLILAAVVASIFLLPPKPPAGTSDIHSIV
ncbi:MFS transporter [Chloroflexota bacterium]